MKLKHRAYSMLKTKSVNEEKRIITGWATTPSPDRYNDIVEPKGVEFQNPMPLLWQHDHRQPVGHVKFGTPTEEGIPFEAEIFDIRTPEPLFNRLEEAWQSVKSGLVRAVSIGFRAIEYNFMEEEGGIRFVKTECYELSLVTIPANVDATIETVKSFDGELLRKAAASGQPKGPVEVVKSTAGAAAKPTKIQTQPDKKDSEMTLAEQIKKALEARKAKLAEMHNIMKAAQEAGETLAGKQAEEYDTLEKEAADLQKHVTRLERLQEAEGETATPVTKAGESIENSEAAAAARGGTSYTRVKTDALEGEKGVAFARMVKCVGLAKGVLPAALEIAKANYGQKDARIVNILKAAVGAGTTSNATWAGNLVGEESKVFADFVEFLRPQTILGRFGTGGIPSLRRVPFRTRLSSQTTGTSAGWVGEGKAKPVTKAGFAKNSLDPMKVAAIAVITMELLRDSSPSADILLRDDLAAAVRERQDRDFINPDKTEDAGISPASITNGIVGTASAGSDADAVRADIATMLTQFVQANNAPSSGVIIMSAVTALRIGLMRNALGGKEFPDINMGGGTLEGFPVITSEFVPTDSDGSIMVMINAGDIWLADEGGVEVDMSTEASLEMDSAPAHNSTTPTPAQLVSLWQTNSVGIRAERTMNWARRRDSSVALITGVNYDVTNAS